VHGPVIEAANSNSETVTRLPMPLLAPILFRASVNFPCPSKRTSEINLLHSRVAPCSSHPQMFFPLRSLRGAGFGAFFDLIKVHHGT